MVLCRSFVTLMVAEISQWSEMKSSIPGSIRFTLDVTSVNMKSKMFFFGGWVD